MKSLKNWVFDLDGTLVDSFGPYFQSLREIFTRYDVPFTEYDIKKSLTMHTTKYLPLYLSQEQIQIAIPELLNASQRDSHHIKPFEGVIQSLDHLKSIGTRMAIWTGRDLKSAQMILENTKLASYFDECVSGTCVTNHKPHPEGLLRIVKNWNCTPNEVVMVGDHDVDMQGAKATQSYAVRVSWAVDEIPNCDIAHKHFATPSDFESWLKSK
jgi:phosphoglycolate phosphatase/pyrophosphatase PpaX